MGPATLEHENKEKIAAEYPQVATRQPHVDALAAEIVLHPGRLDVIVGSNLFGDILSDLAAAVTEGLGLAREHAAAAAVDRVRTPDLCGTATTGEVGSAIARRATELVAAAYESLPF
jgi:tartrate dehydrogenase/decarboxylase/D-malate dehydrogenase